MAGVRGWAFLAAAGAICCAVGPIDAASSAETPHSGDPHAQWGLIEKYCVECHNVTDWAGSVAFDTMNSGDVPKEAKTFEAAIRKLKGGFMPPPGAKQHPDNQTVNTLVSWLETTLDASQTDVRPGRIPLRRLNRREYTNSVRDLLALDVDSNALLPSDEKKDAFDNNAANLQVSPSYLDQYLNAARMIAIQAVGNPKALAVTTTYGPIGDMVISLPPRGSPGEGNQQLYKDGMPFGTRGGMTARHIFPADGDYELTIGDMALGRDVPRMEYRNTVIALLDGKEFYRTDIGGDADQKAIDQEQEPAVQAVNRRLRNIKFHASAGEHLLAVTFLHRTFAESDERIRSTSLDGGQERVQQVHALQVRGPLKITGMGDSASREKIFICKPANANDDAACAKTLITSLAHHAFRRPVTDEDIRPLMRFYENGRKDGGFEAGIRDAVSAVLASPFFLYRIEAADTSTAPRTLTDVELASRMSFFIWGSIPDEELLGLAERTQLSKPDILAHEVKRMIADPRAQSLVDDFAFQWLNLAKLDEIVPERGLFPQASGILDPRPMFREELSLFLDSVLRSDQPITNLLTANYTYLNEPLAELYGIENVKGGQFRKVMLTDTKRYGLLGKGAVLMLTANPDRTSPVLRGAWVLDRVLGTPPSPPPPNVPALPDAGGAGGGGRRGGPARHAALTLRERMNQHSTNPTCHACHGIMDPLGFSMENFNAVGQYRTLENESPVDASGAMPDGTPLKGPDDLRKALASHPEQFAEAMTERLMTYALGRNVDYTDMPTVRRIVHTVSKDDYRFSDIVLQVVMSDAFRKREALPAIAVKTASLDKTPAVGSQAGGH
jgi:mono/diheme cytochrome c family protein